MLGLSKIGQRLFGSSNDREVRPYMKRVEAINALEGQIEPLTDEQLRAKPTNSAPGWRMVKPSTTC